MPATTSPAAALLRALGLGVGIAGLLLLTAGGLTSWSADPHQSTHVGRGLLGLLAAAILLALLWWRLGPLRRRRPAGRWTGLVVLAAGIAAILLGVLARPTPTVVTGMGQGGYLMAAAGIAYVVAGGICLVGRAEQQTPARLQRIGSLVLAIVVMVAAIAVAALATPRLAARANDLVDGTVATPAATGSSTLGGGARWTNTVGTIDLDEDSAVSTPYGPVVLVRSDDSGVDRYALTLLNPSTGDRIWAYRQAGGRSRFRLQTFGDGGRLLVTDNDHGAPFVLDSRTGHRVSTWPSSTADTDPDLGTPAGVADTSSPGPAVGIRAVSKGSDSLVAYDDDGHQRWKVSPGRAISITAEQAGSVVVAHFDPETGGTARTIGYDASSGKQLWSNDLDLSLVGAQRGLMIGQLGVTAGAGAGTGRTTMVALDPRTGRTVWSTPVCGSPTPAGVLVLMRFCGSSDSSVVTAYTVADGKRAWSARFPSGADAAHAVVVGPAGRLVTVRTVSTVSTVCVVVEAGPSGFTIPAAPGWRQAPAGYQPPCRGGIVAAGGLVLVQPPGGTDPVDPRYVQVIALR